MYIDIMAIFENETIKLKSVNHLETILDDKIQIKIVNKYCLYR